MDSETMWTTARARAGASLLSALIVLLCLAAALCAQTAPPAPRPAPGSATSPSASKTPTTTATPIPQSTVMPQPSPVQQPSPFRVPGMTGSTTSPTPAVATPSPGALPSSVPVGTTTSQSASPLTLDEALRLANAQASSFQQATFNERIAAEDLKQAQAAFLPRVTAPLSYLYTSPSLGLPPGTPRAPSFLANNAVGESQAYMNVAGDFDIAGR